MIKVQINYENESEKIKMIEILSNAATVKKISKPCRTGKYYRVYVDIK